MKEENAHIWTAREKYGAIGLAMPWQVRRDGKVDLTRTALGETIVKIFPELPSYVGNIVSSEHRPRPIFTEFADGDRTQKIICIPFYYDNFTNRSNDLILRSCRLMVDQLQENDIETVAIPKSFFSISTMSWENFSKILGKVLDDRIIIVQNPNIITRARKASS